MLEETCDFLEDNKQKRIGELERREELVDLLQGEITKFLVLLSQRSISSQTSEIIAILLNVVNDLERIGDHCENLWRLGQKKVAAGIIFSEIGENETLVKDLSYFENDGDVSNGAWNSTCKYGGCYIFDG